MVDYNFKNITFHKRPIPVQPEYRPVYKIAQIVIGLKKSCRKNKASLLLLHLFSWALKSNENEKLILDYLKSPSNTLLEIWNFEPSLNRALHFAQAENLIEMVLPQGHYGLTERGHKFADVLIENDFVLLQEKAFFDSIKYSITETLVQDISKKWSNSNA
jgi:uncharacterized membrane protein